ncbi:esterase/lipase family protein [Nocardia australiensis]|uniref:esterase/lipase family protein n=1 Tax=Nocardia australiensis TaxID=2887191 RepID=UPI001D152753|nr:alpha/beta fold hydrolase [Nocardia australiensis]
MTKLREKFVRSWEFDMGTHGYVGPILAAILIALGPNAVAPGTAAAAGPQPEATFEEMIAREVWFVTSGQDPAQSPPGVNVPCTPSAAHPRPVVLVHGLPANQYNAFAHIGPKLANAGYCVYSLNYGGTNAFDGGIAGVSVSVPQVSTFIDRVRAETGAAEVDLVGHSGGAFVSLYLAKSDPAAADRIGTVVALAPPTHGVTGGLVGSATRLGLRGVVAGICGICEDVSPGSAALARLHDGPIARPGIRYTTIVSVHDSTVSPPSAAAIDERGVTDIVVQDQCRDDLVGHSGLAYDPSVDSMILNALDPGQPVPAECGSGPEF